MEYGRTRAVILSTELQTHPLRDLSTLQFGLSFCVGIVQITFAQTRHISYGVYCAIVLSSFDFIIVSTATFVFISFGSYACNLLK